MTEPDYNRVSGILTSYWKGAVVYAAVKVGVFEALGQRAMSEQDLASLLNLDQATLGCVLDSLEFMKIISSRDDVWTLTQDGSVLSSSSKNTLSKSAIMWWQEHLDAWRKLDYTLTTGKPSFEKIFGKQFFQWLEGNPKQRELYQESMSEYAKIDYQCVPEIISQYDVRELIDVGGGQGVLARLLSENNPNLDITVLDLPEVIADIEQKNSRIHFIKGDFFNLILGEFDAAILSRILHDWDDSKCQEILKGIINLLKESGYLFVIERVTEDKEHSLLNLDLKLINNGIERNLSEFYALLKNSGYDISKSHHLESNVTVLVCKKIQHKIS